MKEKLSVDYDEMIMGMMMMLLEYDVYCFYEVLDGMGLLDLVLWGFFVYGMLRLFFLLFRLIIFENECCIFFWFFILVIYGK